MEETNRFYHRCCSQFMKPNIWVKSLTTWVWCCLQWCIFVCTQAFCVSYKWPNYSLDGYVIYYIVSKLSHNKLLCEHVLYTCTNSVITSLLYSQGMYFWGIGENWLTEDTKSRCICQGDGFMQGVCTVVWYQIVIYFRYKKEVDLHVF